MRQIDAKTALTLLHHPCAKRILHMAGYNEAQWDKTISREDNILRGLRFIMVTGAQEEFYKWIKEPWAIKTEDTTINVTHIAECGNDKFLDPLITYICENNLINETEYCNSYGKAHPGRVLIYINGKGEMKHQFLDYHPSACSANFTIVYKKLIAVIKTYETSGFLTNSNGNTILVTNKEKVAGLLSSCHITGNLVYVGD